MSPGGAVAQCNHLVLVTRKRLWLPEMKVPAEVFDTEIVIHGAPSKRLALGSHPYQVAVEER